jgi:hypothetical protein
MNPAARLVRTRGLLEARAGEEILMMSPEHGRYFGLNSVASHIWSLADQPRSIAELRDMVCDAFDVVPTQCEADVIAFAKKMIDRGLLRLVD